jgi:NADPH:quinone reductase-like Zn-dependent oxidoreductase
MTAPSPVDTIQAVGISKYGSLENLESRRLPKPSSPTGRQMLVRVRAAAVNPIDIKVREGVYDDWPDYYEPVKPLTQDEPHFHVMGYDGAGVVLGVGPDVKHFKQGDEIY